MAQPKKKWLSASQLFKLAECGEMYRLSYIEKIHGPRAIRMLIGLAAHKAIALDLSHKVGHDGELMPTEKLLDLSRDALVSIWNEGDVDIPEDMMADAAHADAQAAVLDYVGLHHREVAPWINPDQVEAEAMIEIPNFPFNVALVKDIVEEDGTIRDTKTTQKSPPKGAAQVSMQLQLYALHHKLKTGVESPKLVLDYLVRTPKTHKCTYVPLEAVPIAAQQQAIVDLLVRAADVIQAGAYMPNRNSWLCSKSACEYARMGVCAFWSGRE